MSIIRYPTLMVQGTTSDAGKTTIVAALCRLLHRNGIRVAPMKPQNMALNSAVTIDGGEIGRAQALQAQAAGIAAHTDMNPILLKPASDTGAQVIVHGKVYANMEATSYHEHKKIAMAAVLESYQRLQTQYDCLIVEGAGSPAEINLREGDIANMGFAERVDCPVILVADIDRGGVFAHFVGTLACLSASEQARVIGFVINRFRGDLALLQPGMDWLVRTTGKPVLGVIPYLHGLMLDAEDAIQTEQSHAGKFRVVVPVTPRISNHTDFDALRLHPEVDLQFVGPNQAIPGADLIILPGSKNTRADLAFLREQGWEDVLLRHVRLGGKIIGICGGYQMLGQTISDPLGIEGNLNAPAESKGFGLLQVDTTLTPQKMLQSVQGYCTFNSEAVVSGYEIHMGETKSQEAFAVFIFDDHLDGARSKDDAILGTYVHGLFDHPASCNALLTWAGLKHHAAVDYHARREAEIDRLADACAPLYASLFA